MVGLLWNSSNEQDVEQDKDPASNDVWKNVVYYVRDVVYARDVCEVYVCVSFTHRT